jgi:hypothetical protein
MRLPVDKPRLPEVVERFLVDAGCSESARSKCTLSTRLYQDLGVYGDEAHDYMQTLSERFGVDLSGFDFDEYFPREFPGGNWVERTIRWLVPGLGKPRPASQYRPITLAAVEKAIDVGRWQP